MSWIVKIIYPLQQVSMRFTFPAEEIVAKKIDPRSWKLPPLVVKLRHLKLLFIGLVFYCMWICSKSNEMANGRVVNRICFAPSGV
jgi:hypothetical protein